MSVSASSVPINDMPHVLSLSSSTPLSQTYIPLATVLLAISEQTFFLNNWHLFLVQNLLPSLKVSIPFSFTGKLIACSFCSVETLRSIT